MLRLVVLVVLFFKLTSAIVLHNDGSTTIPTELFKPLQPVTEHTPSSTDTNIPETNYKHFSNIPFNNFDEGNFKGYSVMTTYSSDDGVPHAAQIQELRPVHTATRFESLNKPFPLVMHQWNNYPDTEAIGSGSGSGHFQISSRSSYFNSDTMSEPEIRQYHFDSRNPVNPY